jgi:hypothetical protein
MASRFLVGDNDVIEELKTSGENSNTRKSTNLWVGLFKKRAALRKIGEDMETYLTLPQSLVIFELLRENMPVRGLGVDGHAGNST